MITVGQYVYFASVLFDGWMDACAKCWTGYMFRIIPHVIMFDIGALHTKHPLSILILDMEFIDGVYFRGWRNQLFLRVFLVYGIVNGLDMEYFVYEYRLISLCCLHAMLLFIHRLSNGASCGRCVRLNRWSTPGLVLFLILMSHNLCPIGILFM